MNDDELYRRYRIMTGPPPKWRRRLGISLLVVLLAAFGAIACFLNEAAHGPLWALTVGAVFGLVVSGLLARTDFRLSRTDWRKNAFFVVFYFVLISSEKWIVWAYHGRDSFTFYMAYIVAVMTGGLIGIFLLSWSLFSKSEPLIP